MVVRVVREVSRVVRVVREISRVVRAKPPS
jgi:hypothetical protein